MSDYKRFVSYLYEYIAEKKTNNRGFVKVELRSGICRLQFQLKVFSLPEQTPITIYGYIYRDSRLTGYPLGQLRSGKNGISGLITVPARIAGTAYNVLDFNGLILTEPSGKLYGSQWDDNPIIPERFRPVSDNTSDEQKESSADNRTSKISAPVENVAPEISESVENIPQETSEFAENIPQEASEFAENISQEAPEYAEDVVQETSDFSESMTQEASEFAENIPQATFDFAESISPEIAESAEFLTQTDSTASEEELHDSYEPTEAMENPTSIAAETSELVENSEVIDAAETIEPFESEAICLSDDSSADDTSNLVPEQELVTPPPPSIPPVRSGFNHPEETPPADGQTENQPPARQPTPPDIPIDPGDSSNWKTGEAHTRKRQSVQPKKWEERNQHSGVTQQSMGAAVLERGRQTSPWDTIRQQYPSIQPFDDEEINECIRVTIRDFSDLRRRGLPVGCNQFIHHGFQNYRHLLIGRISGSYILGVPGVYNANEQFMASMYGFNNFKPGHLKEGPYNGRSGYWYRTLKP